jgi:hypothetical protein
MPAKPVTTQEVRLEIFLARYALDSLKDRYDDPDNEAQSLFVQSVAESIADIEAALDTFRAFVAQQSPEGELTGKTLAKGLDEPS